jgi:hypothetical protein
MKNIEILKAAVEQAQENGFQYTGKITLANAYSIIFSHWFAECYFGREWVEEGGGYWKEGMERWEHELREMVVMPDPIKYLEKFLKKD